MALERTVEVELLDRSALDVEHQRRQLLEALQQCRSLGAAVRLEKPDDDVCAPASQRLRRSKHRERLAHTRRGAEEDLEPAARGVGFLLLQLGKKLVWIRALLLHFACDRRVGASLA